MIEPPKIIRTTPQRIAFIHLTIPMEEIRNVMGPGIQELMTTIAAQNIAATGPWFTHHLRKPSDTWDFEICIPVGAPVSAVGRVRPGQRAAVTAARTVYQGPYEGLGDAWGEFMDWIAAQGHTPAPDLYECYLTGPDSSPDPDRWRTEFVRPLTD